MDKITFDEKRIAEGYMNRPWLHKKVIERFVSDCYFQFSEWIGCRMWGWIIDKSTPPDLRQGYRN